MTTEEKESDGKNENTMFFRKKIKELEDRINVLESFIKSKKNKKSGKKFIPSDPIHNDYLYYQ